jgi:2-methylcitrate dehydratase PrpD
MTAAPRRLRGENGVFAAELASRGFTGGDEGIDGQWGFFQVSAAALTSIDPCRSWGSYTIVDRSYPCGAEPSEHRCHVEARRRSAI